VTGDVVRVACAQIAPSVEEPESNGALTREAVHEAVSAGARLVVLPELCTSGYVFESADEARAAAEPADGPTLRGWAEEADLGDAVVVGGFCELGDDGLLYNSAAVVDGDGVLGVYRKLHLWDR
jgi:5-aminopentanamidase